MRRPSLPEIDAVLHAYVRSEHPPSTARALAEALLTENAARREAHRELEDYRTVTGKHVIMTVEEAQARMVALRTEEDAASWRWLRSTAGRVFTHTVTAVVIAGLALLWHVLSR
jgi:anti-sigma factor RsiW